MNRLVRTTLLLILFAAALLACSVPSLGGGGTDLSATNTAAFMFIQTQAGSASGTLMPTPPPPPGSEPVQLVTATPSASLPGDCDRAAFVSEEVRDNSAFAPGTTFSKSWTLKNAGNCTWGSGYALVFDSGTSMGEAEVALPKAVAPGETVDVAITLKAPTQVGTYRGFYMLRNPAGQKFALGKDGSKPFWVLIIVRTLNATLDPNTTVTVSPGFINLMDYAPNATWKSCIAPCVTQSDLPFDGQDTEAKGYVKYRGSPTLENDQSIPRALEMHPPKGDNGTVYGIFPVYDVRQGDHFRARIGLIKAGNPLSCEGGNVSFQLSYIEAGAITALKSWQESCDGKLQDVEVDLNGIAGKKVQMVFTVVANGTSTNDNAIWIDARIEP